MKRLLLPVLALLIAATAALPADAIVPPKRCKTIEVKGKKHRIMADGVRCKFAVRTARRYLKRRDEPARWNCTRKSASPSITFRCMRGTTRSVYGVRR